MAAPNKPDDNAKREVPDAVEPEQEVIPTTASEQEGANQLSDDTRGRVFGDTTSSSGGANQPGYHGRDGGIASGTVNNPPADGSQDGNTEEEPNDESPKTL